MSPISSKANATGLFLAFTSPLLFTLFNVGIRILSAGISIYGLFFLRGFVGAALVVVVSRVIGVRLRFARLGALSMVGLSSALSTVCTTTALSKIALYQVVVILYLYPAMTVVLSLVLRVDRITLRAVFGVLTAFVGSVLLVWPDSDAGLEFGLFHGLALLGGFCYAMCLVLIRRLGQGHSGLEPFLFYSLAGIAISWPLSRIFGAGLGIDGLGEVGQGAALACLGSAAQLMAFAAVKFLPPFKVGVIGTLEIFGATLASWLIFDDAITLRAMIGAVIVIYAAVGFQARPTPIEDTRMA